MYRLQLEYADRLQNMRTSFRAREQVQASEHAHRFLWLIHLVLAHIKFLEHVWFQECVHMLQSVCTNFRICAQASEYVPRFLVVDPPCAML